LFDADKDGFFVDLARKVDLFDNTQHFFGIHAVTFNKRTLSRRGFFFKPSTQLYAKTTRPPILSPTYASSKNLGVASIIILKLRKVKHKNRIFDEYAAIFSSEFARFFQL
jgi:hypothetical protein